jgi:hypothetical protein
MFLSPRNRYILVEPVETKKKVEERAFVLPNQYEEVERYKVVKVIDDSTANYQSDSDILVPTQMLEKVEISGREYYLITDNYVIAVVIPTEE